MINFVDYNDHTIVQVDGKYVGQIKKIGDGLWQYFSKGAETSTRKIYPTRQECKNSLGS